MSDIALVVEDGWQGLGLGSILLKEILHAGAQRGIRHFKADVLTEIQTLRRARRMTASRASRSDVVRTLPLAC
jgi:GNAT superfamily N-acetyltransferase